MREGIWYEDRDGVWHFNQTRWSSGAERCGICMEPEDVAASADMIDPVDGTGTYCGPCMDSLTDEERERHLTTTPTPAPTERPAFDSLRVGDRVRWSDPEGNPTVLSCEEPDGVCLEALSNDCWRAHGQYISREGYGRGSWVLVSRAAPEPAPTERPAFDSLRVGDRVRWIDPDGCPPEMDVERPEGVRITDAVEGDSMHSTSGTMDVLRATWDRGEWALMSRAVALEVVPAPEPAATRPSYYNRGGVEAIDVIHAWGLSFDLGSVIKYVCRAGFKGDDVEDLKKARQYLDFEIAQREKS